MTKKKEAPKRRIDSVIDFIGRVAIGFVGGLKQFFGVLGWVMMTAYDLTFKFIALMMDMMYKFFFIALWWTIGLTFFINAEQFGGIQFTTYLAYLMAVAFIGWGFLEWFRFIKDIDVTFVDEIGNLKLREWFEDAIRDDEYNQDDERLQSAKRRLKHYERKQGYSTSSILMPDDGEPVAEDITFDFDDKEDDEWQWYLDDDGLYTMKIRAK